MRELVFIHGRAQHGKDANALKQEWIDAWGEGLAKSGLTMPISPSQIRFPYYGDTLDQLVQGVSDGERAEVVVRGLDIGDDEKSFIQEYVGEVQEKCEAIGSPLPAALPDVEYGERGVLNWPWVQAILRMLDGVSPASKASVALFANDVFRYLHANEIRHVIDEGVRQAFARDTDTVVVGHSLGSVVAYNVLHRYGPQAGWRVPLFVTLGSPLAVSAIRRRLVPAPRHPECVRDWFNALDPRDVVALWPLDGERFMVNPAIENKTDVDNFTENRHGIRGYLSDADVAYRIYAHLT
ncbi:MAG TPA: hypothetical protein VM406_06050 [Noviherbaspirillum sp.]|nr:hypothetical protein [Noviherbaspirillum sp.]